MSAAFFRKSRSRRLSRYSRRSNARQRRDEEVLSHGSDSFDAIPEEDRSNIQMNKSWYGVPVEEVDPLIFDTTFCVLVKRCKRTIIYRFSTSKSLFLFSPLHPFRKFAVYLITHPLFDLFTILAILANCVTLGLEEHKFVPTETATIDPSVRPKHLILDYMEIAFMIIYTIEMLLRIIARGFLFNKFAYLRRKWNILDFISVVTGLINILTWLITDTHYPILDFLQALRAIRALKAFTVFSGIKLMLKALMSSVVRLVDVLLLVLTLILVYSALGFELFQGQLKNKCVVDKGGIADPEASLNQPLQSISNIDDRNRLWTEWVSDWTNWKQRYFPKAEPTQCGNASTARHCEEGFTCLANLGENPENGWIHFDKIGNSMLTTFQVMTTDYWERVYDLVVSTSGVGSVLFFVTIIFLGFYYLLNLMLAVVIMSYENEVILKDQQPNKAVDKLKLTRRQSTFSFDRLSKLNVCKITHSKHRTKSENEWLKIMMTRVEKGYHHADRHGEEFDTENKPKFDEFVMKLVGIKEALQSDEMEEYENRPKDGERRRVGSIISGGRDVSFIIAKQITLSENDEKEEDLPDTIFSSLHKRLTRTRGKQRRCCGCFQRAGAYLSRHLSPIVEHKGFEWFITICIALNTVLLALEHHGQPEILEKITEIGTHIFMAIFTAEVIIKALALQKKYFASRWNLFDMVIVIISYVDMLTWLLNYHKLRAFRCVRLFRVFKLAHSWLTMRILLNIIFHTLQDLWSLTCVLVIVLYIFAVLGITLVGSDYSPGAFKAETDRLKFPSWRWENFWYAFMMVFRVICGEWIEPLLECLEAQNFAIKNKSNFWALAYGKCFLLYFIILLIGNFILFNLFLALLLNSFDAEELNSQREKEKEQRSRQDKMKNIIGLIMKQQEIEHTFERAEEDEEDEQQDNPSPQRLQSDLLSPSPTPSRITSETRLKKRFRKVVHQVIVQNRIKKAQQAIRRVENKRRGLVQKFFLKNPIGGGLETFQHDTTPESSESGGFEHLTDCCPTKPWMVKCYRCCCKRKPGIVRRKPQRYSLWHRTREYCLYIVNTRVFDFVICALIIGSSILVCFEDYTLESKPYTRKILCILNYIFTGIFVGEMLLKCFALGLYRYVTNFWTLLDGFLVVISLVIVAIDIYHKSCSIGLNQKDFDFLTGFRALRALRPLRAVSRLEGMKIVVSSLVHAIPAISNVMLVCLVFWLIFAVIGVQLFKGKFYMCVDAGGGMIDHLLVPDKEACCAKANSHGYSWVNSISNYDNVFNGYLSLFQIATFEGWMEIMSYSVNSVEVDKQPIVDNRLEVYIFYVIFIIFGSFFTLKLFITVIIDNFNMLKKKYEGNILEMLLTPSQRNYYIAMKNVGLLKPRKYVRPPKNSFRLHFYHIAMSKQLEAGVIALIFVNVVTEMFHARGEHYIWLNMLMAINATFSSLYVLEVIVKIVGLGTYYFTKPWNIFDLIMSICSVVESFLLVEIDVVLPVPSASLRIVRILHVGRLMQGVKRLAGIRKLLYALTSSLPAIFNIGSLLFLVTFVYAILGMALFMNAPRKWSVDDIFNFDTFLGSCLMLFRLMTVAGWNEVLDSLSIVKPVCGDLRHLECGLTADEPRCPSPWVVIPYIVSYLLLTNQVMMNLFCAIILENYVEATDEQELGIVESDIESFYLRWSRYDHYATQFIHFDNLSDFLDCLKPPFRIPKPNTTAIVMFNLPIARGGKIHCLDLLSALINHILGAVDDSPEFRRLQHRMEAKFRKQFPNRNLLDIVSDTRRWKIEYNAVIRIQRWWRRKRAQRRPDLYQEEREPPIKVYPEPEGIYRGGFGSMVQRRLAEQDPVPN